MSPSWHQKAAGQRTVVVSMHGQTAAAAVCIRKADIRSSLLALSVAAVVPQKACSTHESHATKCIPTKWGVSRALLGCTKVHAQNSARLFLRVLV